jgi:hypothetical protein
LGVAPTTSKAATTNNTIQLRRINPIDIPPKVNPIFVGYTAIVILSVAVF